MSAKQSPSRSRARRLDAAKVKLLYVHELRSVLRDRRAVILSILLPLVTLPLIFYANRYVEEKRETSLAALTYEYAVTGSEAALARRVISAGKERRRALSEAERPPGDAAAEPAVYRDELVEIEVADPKSALDAGGLHFYLEAGPPAAEAAVPSLILRYRGNRDVSASGAFAMKELLRDGRQELRRRLLLSRGITVEPSQIATLSAENVASSATVAGSTLGRFLTVLVVFFIVTGGAVVSADLLAGEKERGTLETLLTTAAGRDDIIAAKLLTILSVALLITTINVANLFVYVTLGLIPLPPELGASLPPLAVIVLLFLLLPLAALLAAVLLLISGYAKTYKEAQLYLMPLQLGALVPALAAVLPAIELRSAIMLVPIANVSVAVREVMVGRYDVPALCITWLVSTAAAVLVTRLAAHNLSAERLITSAERDRAVHLGGPALFERKVLGHFALLWALLLITSFNQPAEPDVRVELCFNLLVLFFGASVLMIRHYRLKLREVLALRAPRWPVWVAVLIGAPAAMVVAQGVFRLTSLILPVPPELYERFSAELLPEAVPRWQLYLMLTVMPGFFEEIAFRGVLLHGLRRRLHPAALCLVVGLTFGVFHLTLWRIVPTAFLGAVLAAVTLLSGSLLPAMLWHALNNGLGVLALHESFSPGGFALRHYAVATVALALAFGIIYRYRTVYPQLRPWSRRQQP